MTSFFKVDVLSVSKSQNKPKTIQKAQTNAGRITYIVIVLMFDNKLNPLLVINGKTQLSERYKQRLTVM